MVVLVYFQYYLCILNANFEIFLFNSRRALGFTLKMIKKHPYKRVNINHFILIKKHNFNIYYIVVLRMTVKGLLYNCKKKKLLQIYRSILF